MATQAALDLEAGNLRLGLSPGIGGAISAFEWTDGGPRRSIMRKSPDPLESVLDAACFPLVPYVNRIRDGQFCFLGKVVKLRPNMAGDPSPLHGQGWLNSWTVEDAGSSSATLAYRHRADEWPWDYEARQHFALDDAGLSITLECRNISEGPMPCGLGLHPYFPCGPETRLNAQVGHAWTIDKDVLPVDKVPAEGRYDLKDRLICGQGLDNGFSGWDGRAVLSDPDWPYRLDLLSEATFFQVYSPPQGGFFVAEPVTHANAALNAPEREWAELGIRVLEPGQQMRVSARVGVRAG